MKESCREVLDRAYLVLDGEGTPAERQEISQHLEECQPCLERHGLDAEVKRILSRLQGSQCCPDALKTKIASLLHDA